MPTHVAKIMTYPERVNRHNLDKLRRCVRNARVHPGANHIEKRGSENRPAQLRRQGAGRELAVGDVVERHMADGDVVLFNRQRSLHKLSIMSHHVM